MMNVHHERAGDAKWALWLTSPGSGEDFDACGRWAWWRAEDTTEAQAARGLGWGVLAGGIGEDSLGRTGAHLRLHRSRLRTWRQLAGRAPRRHSCGGAGWTDETLSLGDKLGGSFIFSLCTVFSQNIKAEQGPKTKGHTGWAIVRR